MASPELQALMAQMRDFLAAMMQQQQTAIEAMMNNERKGRPAAQAQGINEKYYKRVESFTGEQAWRDWSFQFKSATKTANEAAYHLIETAEKEEKEIDDALSLTEEERSLSSGIFNILGTKVNGEHLQMLHTSGSSGFEAWRKLSKRYGPTTPMRGMQLMMAAINPGKAKGLEEVAIHIDRWEAKVLALSRDFNELLSEKMRGSHVDLHAAPKPPACADPAGRQDRGLQEHQRQSRDHRRGQSSHSRNPDAMECDAVHRSTGHAEAWEDNSEACDVDAMNSKSGLFCYRCGGQCHIAAKCATPAPTKGKGKYVGKGGKAGGKGVGNKGERQRRVEWILLLLREGGTRTSCLLDQAEGRGEKREDRRRGGRGGYRPIRNRLRGQRKDVPARAAYFQQVPGTEW